MKTAFLQKDCKYLYKDYTLSSKGKVQLCTDGGTVPVSTAAIAE